MAASVPLYCALVVRNYREIGFSLADLLVLELSLLEDENDIFWGCARPLSAVIDSCPSSRWPFDPDQSVIYDIVEGCLRELMHWNIIGSVLVASKHVLTLTAPSLATCEVLKGKVINADLSSPGSLGLYLGNW